MITQKDLVYVKVLNLEQKFKEIFNLLLQLFFLKYSRNVNVGCELGSPYWSMRLREAPSLSSHFLEHPGSHGDQEVLTRG